MAVAAPGDTVFLRAGTYRETLRPAKSGEAGNPSSRRAGTGRSLKMPNGWTFEDYDAVRKLLADAASRVPRSIAWLGPLDAFCCRRSLARLRVGHGRHRAGRIRQRRGPRRGPLPPRTHRNLLVPAQRRRHLGPTHDRQVGRPSTSVYMLMACFSISGTRSRCISCMNSDGRSGSRGGCNHLKSLWPRVYNHTK